MSRRVPLSGRAIAAFAVVVCAAAGAAVLSTAGGDEPARSRQQQDRYLGLLAPRARVDFALSLRMRGSAMERYGALVSAGDAPSLTAAQIGERFGISRRALAYVRRALAAAGITVREEFRQRTQLLVSGAAVSVEHLLRVSLGQFSDWHGARYHRPLGAAVIPPQLRPYVVLATHLDTKPLPLYAAVPTGGMTASDLAALYDLRPLIARDGLDGSGQTVAVYSQDTYLDSDLAAFDAEHHIVGAPPIRRVEVEPGPPVKFYLGEGGGGAGEVDLDIDVIRELAPKAQIINYETPPGQQYLADGIDRIVSDGKAKLANFSYAICEFDAASSAASLRGADDNSFRAAEDAGVTAFVASGDEGAYSCQRYDLTDHRLSVEWPSSSPHVVSVGGTHVDLRSDGTRFDEVGWEDILSAGGGGGGVSAVFPRPSWQSGVPGIDNRFTASPPMRQLPDVSADAALGSPYAVYSDGHDVKFGGTSAAAPFWTASFVLIDELCRRRTGHPLPFIAPLLYRAAARDPAAFYDVTLGGNRYYRAARGWDYATGLGAPDMARLAADVIALAPRA